MLLNLVLMTCHFKANLEQLVLCRLFRYSHSWYLTYNQCYLVVDCSLHGVFGQAPLCAPDYTVYAWMEWWRFGSLIPWDFLIQSYSRYVQMTVVLLSQEHFQAIFPPLVLASYWHTLGLRSTLWPSVHLCCPELLKTSSCTWIDLQCI